MLLTMYASPTPMPTLAQFLFAIVHRQQDGFALGWGLRWHHDRYAQFMGGSQSLRHGSVFGSIVDQLLSGISAVRVSPASRSTAAVLASIRSPRNRSRGK
jgi:hypothetical protein